MVKVAGIYSITSRTTQKIYIGSSNHIELRWRTHKRDLGLNRHKNPILQAHANKYGLDDLEFEVMEAEPDLNLRLGLEQLMINALAGPACFNVCKVANSHYGTRGRFVSGETRARMSAAQRGKTPTPEARANMSRAQKARTPYTQEEKEEIARKKRASMKGRVKTPEHRAKLSAALTGRAISPETRAKMSLSRKGRKNSPESIAKQAAAVRGREKSPESIAKRQATLAARYPNGEIGKKISAAKLAAAALRRRPSGE